MSLAAGLCGIRRISAVFAPVFLKNPVDKHMEIE
jgi:hypothetical protein